jgi:hypothetical protein
MVSAWKEWDPWYDETTLEDDDVTSVVKPRKNEKRTIT